MGKTGLEGEGVLSHFLSQFLEPKYYKVFLSDGCGLLLLLLLLLLGQVYMCNCESIENIKFVETTCSFKKLSLAVSKDIKKSKDEL